ncbi:Uncharacterised protein [Klebsiella pneumoniae]|uniref:Uncharacterized protein n=1 Tax=Klebsiella pneumoniae TaxID=573 RepID=A0A377XBQ4_KLEPN|nr:Uncharacterised protein [Klebsiella pneumoniae]
MKGSGPVSDSEGKPLHVRFWRLTKTMSPKAARAAI